MAVSLSDLSATQFVNPVENSSSDRQFHVKMNSKELFELAEAARTAGRIEDANTILSALARDPDLEIRAEARFRLGVSLASEKKFKQAAIVYRKLLDEKPTAARARLELARMLALMGDANAARSQLRQAQAGGLPPEVALVVNQFARALRSKKHFGGSIELAFAPDTNINRATSATTLDTIIAPLTLDRDARAQSGVGIKIGGQAFGRLPVSNNLDLLARVSATASIYRSHRFNDVSTTAAIGPDVTLQRDRIQPAVFMTRRIYGGKIYAETVGGSLTWSHALGRTGQIAASFSGARARYRDNDLQSGAIYDGSVTVERAFNPKSGGSISLSANHQTAVDPGYASFSGGASIVAWREVGTMTLYVNASYRRLQADERLFLYPRTRADNFVGMGAGGVFRKIGLAGLAPILRLSWERNASTVGIYDFRRTVAEVGVTRAF